MHEALMCDSMREARDLVSLDLWQRMKATEGDDEWMPLRNELYLLYERLSFSFAKRYMKNSRLCPDDIRQCCRIGVIQAIDEWDPERGSLTTMVAYWVSNEIKAWLRAEQVYQTSSSADQSDSTQEPCQPRHRKKCDLTYVSFRNFFRFGECDGDSVDFTDRIMEQSVASHEETVVLDLCVESALWALSPENRGLVELYYGLNGQMSHTLREIVPLFEKSMTHQGINARLNRTRQQMAPLLDGF